MDVSNKYAPMMAAINNSITAYNAACDSVDDFSHEEMARLLSKVCSGLSSLGIMLIRDAIEIAEMDDSDIDGLIAAVIAPALKQKPNITTH